MLQDIEFEHPNHWGRWLLILDVPLQNLHDVVDSNGIDLPIELRLRGGQDVLAPSPDGSLYLFEWYQVGGSRRVDDLESTVLPLDAVLVEVSMKIDFLIALLCCINGMMICLAHFFNPILNPI